MRVFMSGGSRVLACPRQPFQPTWAAMAVREAHAILTVTEPSGTEHVSVRLLDPQGATRAALAESLAAWLEPESLTDVLVSHAADNGLIVYQVGK